MDPKLIFAAVVLVLLTNGINAANRTSPSPSPSPSSSPSPSPSPSPSRSPSPFRSPSPSPSPSRSPSPSPSTSASPAAGVVCNKTSYANVYPIDNYVRHVLEELGDEVSGNKDYARVIKFPEINKPIMSGHGACIKSMSAADCSSCIKDGAKKVIASCPHRIGALFNGTGCKLGYNVYQDVV